MPRLTLLLAPLLLAACAAGVTPQPQAARLSADALTLQMSGGQNCRLPRAQAAFDGPQGWGGPVQGCAGVARVEVALAPAIGLRAAVEGLFAALTLDGLIAPLAEVRVISDTGRVFLFASPPPVED